MLDEFQAREQLAKKMKLFNTITRTVDTDLVTSTVANGRVTVVTFARIYQLACWYCIKQT